MVFTDDNSGKDKKVIVSVKGGHNVNVAQIRDLGHVIERENAAIGVFLTLDPPTKPMLTEAAEKGFYHSPGWTQRLSSSTDTNSRGFAVRKNRRSSAKFANV